VAQQAEAIVVGSAVVNRIAQCGNRTISSNKSVNWSNHSRMPRNLHEKEIGQQKSVCHYHGGRKRGTFLACEPRETAQATHLVVRGRSFLQQAVDRVEAVVPIRNVLVITNEVQAPEVRKQLPRLPKENVITEPVGRDTCAAVTLGAALVGARSTTGVMAVLPADHVIPEEKSFSKFFRTHSI